MNKLKTHNEFQDGQQEKHEAYLKKGFHLKSTRRDSEGTTCRTYIKSK